MVRTGKRTLAGLLAVAGLWAGLAGPARAADEGEAILTERCAGCHNLTGPAPATLDEIRARKGPDLFYAGNKYRKEWVAEWLQEPTRIRPAGMFYGNHIRTTAKWDEVDKSTLKPHLKLPKGEAKAVAEALMRRRGGDGLVKGVEVKPARMSAMMGDLMFDKFKGCIACHMSGPDYGGLSGPELYTAARRLKPEYAYSFMRNPQAWDPRIWMPNTHLSDTDLNKLWGYLELIAEEDD